jgi:hypothetical protein
LRPIELGRLRITRAFRWALPSPAEPPGVAGRFYRFASGFGQRLAARQIRPSTM